MYLNYCATNAARAHSKATGPARAVLYAICFHADDESWQAEPGKDTIAADSGLSIPTVKRALKTLVDLGELEVEERPVKGNKHQTNLYTIKLPRDEQPQPKAQKPRTPKPAAEAKPNTAAGEVAVYQSVDKFSVLRDKIAAA